MASITSIRSANAAAFGSTTYRPTALFVGGTSGCGEGTASAFARATKGNAHILICGRNKANAERIIATFPKTPQSRYEFVECDASLMANVVKAAADVKSRIAESGTLNYLVLSQGLLNLNGFDATSEGMDVKVAVCFYSRWKFVDELLPCLQKAAAQGQEARVMNILNPSLAQPLDVDDLGLRKNYSIRRLGQGATYTNMMVDEYARRYASVSFIHSYPGYVNTPISKGFPLVLRMFMAVSTMIRAESIEDCGERMTALLADPAFKSGGFYLDQFGGKVDASKLYLDGKGGEALVAHYTQEMAPFV